MFIVLDTEGKDEIREIAILDHNGSLIYEAFTLGHSTNSNIRLNLKPLAEILTDFTKISQAKTIFCHNAEHDRQVIERSYAKAKIPLPPLKFGCTFELAQQKFPKLLSYSLDYLSKYFNLKINNRRFNPVQAHTARYDAEFTYQLYLRLIMQNPFDSSRVDSPFQNHPDFRNVYEAEYELLASVLTQIKSDPNHQSRGAVIIGEAGSGKTHLIMRIAQKLLATNRLLFIRQPNNASAVLHHTYSRILESFAEKVPGKTHTQLELLIASSFINIFTKSAKFQTTQKGKDILISLKNDSLNLYQRLGKEGAAKNLESWQFIERNMIEWWNSNYSNAGYSTTILQGIIRYCSYTDPIKKGLTYRWLAAQQLEPEASSSIGLTNWQEDMSREEFALEAIAVFAKLSILDQPLIIVFDQLEGLGQPHNALILQSFGEAVKELLTHVPNSLIILNLFPERWQQFQTNFDGSIVDRISQYQVRLNRPKADKLRQILQIKAGNINLNSLFSSSELDDILSQSSIRAILNRASAFFRSRQNNIPLPQSPSVSLESKLEQLELVLHRIAQLVSPFHSALEASLQDISAKKPEIVPKSSTELLPDSAAVALNSQAEVSELNDYFQTQKAELTESYDRPTIISDADDIGKLATILEAFGADIDHLRLGRQKLPELLLITNKNQVISFLNLSGSSFTSYIKNFNELIINYPNYQFHLLRDAREPVITGKVGKDEIAKLSHAKNGKFTIMDKRDRLNFELIYKTLIDIQEKDLDVELNIALEALKSELNSYWLIESLT